MWVPIENTRPVYTQPALIKLDERFFAAENFSPETALIKLPELFTDVDPAEKLEWELETPKALQGLVELDSTSGQIKLSSGIDKITKLPVGSHRLLIRQKTHRELLVMHQGSHQAPYIRRSSRRIPEIVKGSTS